MSAGNPILFMSIKACLLFMFQQRRQSINASPRSAALRQKCTLRSLSVQVEGAFMQGLGLFTLEELHYSPRGVLLTRGPGSYKIPAFGDIPSQLTVSLLRDAPNQKAIFASKV